jgi:hypothetical protein
MNTNVGVEVLLPAFPSSVIDKRQWSASRPGQFIPEERAPSSRLGVTDSWCNMVEQNNYLLFSDIELRLSDRPVRSLVMRLSVWCKVFLEIFEVSLLLNGLVISCSSPYFPFVFSFSIFSPTYLLLMDRDSVVGIATRYELDGPWIESRCGRDFLHPSRPALGPT